MKKKSIMPVLSTLLLSSMLFSPSVMAAGVDAKVATNVGVQYKTHIQDKGWERDWKTDGQLSGTVGEWKRLEGLEIELVGDFPADANIQTYVHVQNEGDKGPFYMGENAGTEGKGLRLERIKLVLNNMPGYRLKYNVQVENKGWLRDEYDDSTWFISGETAGTTGLGLRLEGIRIKLVEVNEEYETYLATLAAAPEGYYTPASWTIYEKVVNANVVTEDNTKAEIIAATQNIITAQKKLVKGKNITAYMAALAAVKESEYTPETWAVYQSVVDTNVVTQTNTQTEINTATYNILQAQKQLQNKVNLTLYLETLAAVREVDYTTASWAEYQKVLAAYSMSENNTQTQVDAATNIIDLAQKKMVRKFDFTAYNELLALVKEEDYVASSWTVYQAVLGDNIVTENDTQTDIEKAMINIEAAQKKLVKLANLTYYNAALGAVKKDDYTTASWTSYQKSITSIIVNKTSKQDVVDAAIDKVLEAQLSLVDKGDMVYYNAALAAVIRTDYTTTSWATYQKVVEASVVIPADGQEAIDAATQKIEAAQKKLVKAGDLTDYNAALAAVTEKDWTSVSWATYQKVVKANVMTGDKGQLVIDAATEKIKTAQGSLIKKGDITEYEALLEPYEINKALYTSASWAIYQKVLDTNVMTEDKSQTEINNAITKIKEAQKKLVFKGGLDEYIAVLDQVVEDDYTVASWTIYKKVLAANVMTKDKSQAEIDLAIAKIEAAQLSLVKKGVTTEYDALVDKYAGKVDEYTTASWDAYQKVLAANVMTTENTKSQIDSACAKIRAAQEKLIKAPLAELKAYDETVAQYADRKDEFTPESWDIYQDALLANYVNKDSTSAVIIKATSNIKAAQKKLVNAADIQPFLDAIDLYQDNIRMSGEYKNNATAASWKVYEDLVLQYAKFQTNGDWIPTGGDADDITEATSEETVTNVTLLITNARKNIVLVDALKTAFVTYDAAVKLADGTSSEDYTVNSYKIYEYACLTYAFPERVKAEVYQVNAGAINIEAARNSLELRATDLAMFNSEVSLYLTSFNTDMVYDKATGLYIPDQCRYTIGTWTGYEDIHKKYVITDGTRLDQTNNTQDDYDDAVIEFANARAALVETSKYVSKNITKLAITTPGVTVGTDLLARAQALLTIAGYTVTVVDLPAAPNAGVTPAGVVNGAAGSLATISFKITQNTDPTNTYTVTIADMLIS